MTTHPLPLRAWTVLACAALAACGGGALAASDTEAFTADADADARATAAAAASAGAVQLASANAAGTAGNLGGLACAISTDAQQVLMRSAWSNLVSGDNNFQDDLFLKNLATGAVTPVNTAAAGATIANRTELLCHGMSADGTWVAFTAATGGNSLFQPGPETEATLLLKNTRTGELLRVSPPRSSLPNIQNFTFGSITPDGSRVAFIAQPTTTYLGACTTVANGPVGVAGLYALTLATGGSQWLMPSGTTHLPRAYLVHDTASRVAFLRFDPATAQRTYAFVRDTATGSEQRADRSAANVNGNGNGNGNTTTFAISGNGQHVVLGSSSTNLLRLPRNAFAWQVYVKTLQGAPGAQ